MNKVAVVGGRDFICVSCLIDILENVKIVIVDRNEELSSDLNGYDLLYQQSLETRIIDIQREERILLLLLSLEAYKLSLINYVLSFNILKTWILTRLRYIYSFEYY